MVKTLTKKEFIRAIVKGWKEQRLPYAEGVRYNTRTGGMCALGVAQHVLYGTQGDAINGGWRPKEIDEALVGGIARKIAVISNAAGNKTRAIRNLKAELPEF